MSDTVVTFAHMGTGFQEKLVNALLTDPQYAEQMMDVLKPRYLELRYLETVVDAFFSHKHKYGTFPSPDLVEIMVTKADGADPLIASQATAFLKLVKENPLNGDRGFIMDSSLDFCKRQVLKEAMVQAIDRIEESRYDDIQTLIKDALNKGTSHDLGQDYAPSFRTRVTKGIRQPVSTGWPVIDKVLNGGWERRTLTTFIAPTGAGKSMFLVNCAAAAIAQGLNAVYITCEMADYKIGLRVDSYFSGVEINSVAQQQDRVEASVREKARGRLFIKEFPTKTATVQTVRSYLQRLLATHGFNPDVLVVDYADLLRSSRGHGDKRFELESVYEDLRALSQELNLVLITADQTNRSGLDMEIVTIGQIGESYAKATVCDVIMTVSRKAEDKQTNSGRLFVAKSRLGGDGIVFPFILNTATVKVEVLEQGEDPIALFLENNRNLQEKTAERYSMLMGRLRSTSGQ